MDVLTKLQALIAEGYSVKDMCYSPGSGDYWSMGYISGEEYITWLQKCKMFVKTNVQDRELYEEFSGFADNANGNGVSKFEKVIGMLKALETYNFEEKIKVQTNNKIDKVFISHSSKDLPYVELLVQLLNSIGIKKSEDFIFCSSLPGYDIPYGENIYDFLKQELENSNIMVLFVLSHNYYQSSPCLNEMGAAWVTSKVYNSILTPNFDFKHLSGAIDPSKISFYMNDANGLDKFKDKVIELFELENVDYKIWNGDKKKFIDSVEEIAISEATTLNTQVKIEKVTINNKSTIELQLRFINVSDREVEFKFIDFELNDSLGNKINLTAEDGHLENFKLYSKENKVVKWNFNFEDEVKYNARRDNPNLSKVEFEIYH